MWKVEKSTGIGVTSNIWVVVVEKEEVWNKIIVGSMMSSLRRTTKRKYRAPYSMLTIAVKRQIHDFLGSYFSITKSRKPST